MDLFQEIPLDDRSRFVRFYGEEGTVLIDSDQYDLKFQVPDHSDPAQPCKIPRVIKVTFAIGKGNKNNFSNH